MVNIPNPPDSTDPITAAPSAKPVIPDELVARPPEPGETVLFQGVVFGCQIWVIPERFSFECSFPEPEEDAPAISQVTGNFRLGDGPAVAAGKPENGEWIGLLLSTGNIAVFGVSLGLTHASILDEDTAAARVVARSHPVVTAKDEWILFLGRRTGTGLWARVNEEDEIQYSIQTELPADLDEACEIGPYDKWIRIRCGGKTTNLVPVPESTDGGR
jgi:hypothetical protein